MQNYRKTIKITLHLPTQREAQLTFSEVPSRCFSLHMNTFTSYFTKMASYCESCLAIGVFPLALLGGYKYTSASSLSVALRVPLSRCGPSLSHPSPTEGRWVGTRLPVLTRNVQWASLTMNHGVQPSLFPEEIPVNRRAESRETCCKDP